jgi:aminoglycoside 6'-N-acetyltransferase
MGVPLSGNMVRLRDPVAADVAILAAIRAHPDVYRWWRGGHDLLATVIEEINEETVHSLVVELDGRTVGLIQWGQESDPDYRHANIDIYLDPAVHGRGIGSDAVRTLAAHLFSDHGHHRVVIDPAAHNAAAIACYRKVGFRAVGVMRQYERGPDGTWHDALLMDLIADEFSYAA